MGWSKKFDLILFTLVQYLLPSAITPDFIMMIVHHRLSLLSLLIGLMLSLSCWGMFVGLRRIYGKTVWTTFSVLRLIIKTLWGVLYMMHWLIVMPCVRGRMSIRAKRLK